MLEHIQVRDLVIVQKLSLDLSPGMTALTGETGAGKSILIDALGLALGAKADKSMIRAGCAKAEVNVRFDLSGQPAILQWLQENELESGQECILRRVLVREGRSRSFINGRPAPLQLLADLGSQLVDIHGQHEHQTLLKSPLQRRLLDAWAGHQPLLESLSSCYQAWRNASRELEQLRQQTAEGNQRLDYLRFQIAEFEQLALAEGDLEQLDQEQRRLANAEHLGAELNQLLALLFDNDSAAQPLLAKGSIIVEQLSDLFDDLRPAAELLESARIQVEEAASLLREAADRIEYNPERLAEVDRRLGEIHQLARKHRVEPRQLPELFSRLQLEVETLNNAEATLSQLELDVEREQRAYLKIAEKLSRKRIEAAEKLSCVVTNSMQELGLRGGVFAIQVAPLQADQPTHNGLDQVTFMVSANPGQPLAPLARVASGGELSRISLAIQVATANVGSIPTLIFDEVDVGIGGAVAETVGKLLRRLGKARQVLCVTHLPQVASQAHAHLLVAKESDDRSTRTSIRELNEAQRIEEIARMVSGSRITNQTLAHAQEMIEAAGG